MNDPGKLGRVAIYQTDAQGRCVYVNSALCDLFGLTEKEALGDGWLSRIHPEDRDRVSSARQYATSPIPVSTSNTASTITAGRGGSPRFRPR